MGDQMKIDVEALLDDSKKTPNGPRCQTCLWLDSRPQDEQKQWAEAFENRRYDASQIVRAMAKVKSEFKLPGRLSAQRHRRFRHWEES